VQNGSRRGVSIFEPARARRHLLLAHLLKPEVSAATVYLARCVTMAVSDLIRGLEILVPIAKAVPVLGTPVEGSLEAAIKILQYAEVRALLARIYTFF
jgi:hypothetical protein